jgi:sodium/hydrogen exchanger 8
MGLLACVICRYTNLSKYPSKEITLLLLFAYLAYAVAEAIELSGIMALFFCGIVLSHYNWHNLSGETQAASVYVFHAFAHTSETVVFAYIGICVFTGAYATWNFGFMVLAILFCLLGRAVNIFPISALANRSRKQPIPFNMQGVIWFAGLRGAIAFALAINMPQPEQGPKWNNDVIVTTTLGIVIFTTVVCGSLTESILTRSGMRKASSSADDEDVGELLPTQALTGAKSGAASTHRAGGMHAWWRNIDQQYMRRWFGGDAASRDGGADSAAVATGVYTSSSSAGYLDEGGPASAASPSAGIMPSVANSGMGMASKIPVGDVGSYQAFGADEGDIGAGSGSFFGAAAGKP